MAKILEAKSVVELQLGDFKNRVSSLAKSGIVPSMKVILVGNNPASEVYVKNKKKLCEDVGATCEILRLAESISTADFVKKVKEISSDKSVHGCFVQLPLPKQLQSVDLPSLLPPEKDVDGFTAQNFFKMLEGDKGQNCFLPCTPKGIVTLLNHYKIDIQGKNVVVIGRSMIVGKPMASLLTNYNATVTLCHSHTLDIKKHTQQADIIIVAIGKTKFLKKEFLSSTKNQIIIDVGMNKDTDGSLCGDVDFNNVLDHCAAITPVPGGVGRMTVLSLIDNLIFATERGLKK